jgi:hypothetical protein
MPNALVLIPENYENMSKAAYNENGKMYSNEIHDFPRAFFITAFYISLNRESLVGITTRLRAGRSKLSGFDSR